MVIYIGQGKQLSLILVSLPLHQIKVLICPSNFLTIIEIKFFSDLNARFSQGKITWQIWMYVKMLEIVVKWSKKLLLWITWMLTFTEETSLRKRWFVKVSVSRGLLIMVSPLYEMLRNSCSRCKTNQQRPTQFATFYMAMRQGPIIVQRITHVIIIKQSSASRPFKIKTPVCWSKTSEFCVKMGKIFVACLIFVQLIYLIPNVKSDNQSESPTISNSEETFVATNEWQVIPEGKLQDFV